MKTLKIRRGASLVTLSIYVLVILIATIFTISPPNLNKISDDALKDQAGSLDVSLAQWYQFHGGTYPVNLQTMVTLGNVPSTIDLTPFSYAPASGNTTYRLTVTLRSGKTYQSPGSKY